MSWMTAQIPIDHHFTPVFYLKAWEGSDGRIIRYSRPYDLVKAKSSSPTQTGSQKYLYSLEGVPSEYQAYLETHFFKPLDTRAAIAHRMLLDGKLKALTDEHKSDWARFLLSMQLRTPSGMRDLQRTSDHLLRQSAGKWDAELAEVIQPGDPTNIYDWTAKYQPAVLANAHKEMLPTLIDHGDLGQYLVNMIWATIDLSDASHTLLTCDRPLFSTHGWKDPSAAVFFPIGPRLIFLAANTLKRALEFLDMPPTKLVRFANDQIAHLAFDFVVGFDTSHLAFVEGRLRRPGDDPVPGPLGKGRPGCPG